MTSPHAPRTVTRTVLHAAVLLAACGGPKIADAVPAPPGTEFPSSARVSYIDAATGIHVLLTSDVVNAVVQPMEAAQLSGARTVIAPPNATVAVAHQLVNTGNIPTTYKLTLASLGGDFVADAIALVQDTNGNGLADPGEPTLANGSSVALPNGATLNLVVVASVPAVATTAQRTQIQLTVRGQTSGATATSTDTLIVAGALVTVTKTASTATPVQGSALSYTLTARNSGTLDAQPVTVTVNGQPAAFLILRDAIPANTVFATVTSPSPGVQPLYHQLADPANTYLTAQPATNLIDGVAWAVSTLPAGVTLSGTLGLAVAANAAGTLVNTGYVDFLGKGTWTVQASNAVTLPLPALAPTVTFYSGSTYTTPTRQFALAAPLYVQVNAAQCNTDPTVVLTHPVTLASALTGDTETYVATETAPNTGLFRIAPSVITADAASHAITSGDSILEVADNDRVTATVSGCGAATSSASVLIEPSATVFDSKTNAPVAGATVQLIDVSGAGNHGTPGGAAAVFEDDGITTAPSTFTTTQNGKFRFPFVPPGSYRLAVVPPNALAFPSKVALASLPPGRNVVAGASFGSTFALAGGGPILTDIPLDPSAAGGLFVQMVASKSVAAVGDFVDYTVTVVNDTGLSLPAFLDDSLPAGFAFVKGSARLNGAVLGDPGGGAGPALVFGIGTLAPGTQLSLTYRIRIGPAGTTDGGITAAHAVSGLTQSNYARVAVKVEGSVLSDQAYVFGKVFADCNHDRIQDEEEPGIPGVRIYLDNGTYAVTDLEGKYSVYGLTPRTHVAKVDASSLPGTAVLEVLDNRNAFDAGSRFVDLRNGEFQKADFAVAACSVDLRSQIAARREALRKAPAEIATLAAAQIALNPVAVADPRTLNASGVIGQRSAPQSDVPAAGAPAPRTTGATAAVVATASTASTVATGEGDGPTRAAPSRPEAGSLAAALPTLSSELDFIGLLDGAVMPGAQTRVRVKGAFGTQLALSVNGRTLSDAQVGERSSLESTGTTAWEYVGVDLEPGHNVLVVSMLDPFGNVRGTRRLHLIAPGALARIAIGAPPRTNADVDKALDVTIELQDAHGVRIDARTEVTLEATAGEWQTPDLDPKQPGVQAFVEGGLAHFKLMPPVTPGRGRLRVSSDAVRAEAEITYQPNLRPLLASGLAEGVLSLHNPGAGALVRTQTGDGFEREIQNVSHSFADADAAARASLFLKGKILGSSLLTMAYDSDKPGDTPLFRDIQPDQYYPVYGDSATKGFDAQSTGRLYVRIDHGTSYGVYGDFSTQSDNPARVLTQYSRALNGVKSHLEDGRLTVDNFVSDTASTQVIDELPANGTSGPYHLSQASPLVNSQQVDIITRDRNQPSLVLSDTPLTAYTDYAVDAFSGQILFKSPVPSLDANLNPIYIRVAYEVGGTGGEKYWVGGVDVRGRILHDLTVGGTVVRDTNPLTRETLAGSGFLWAPNKETTLVGEVAHTQTDLAGTGDAHRLELKHTDARVQARIYAVQTDATFDNPNSTYTAGAAEYGAKISATFDANNRLLIDALKTSTAGSVVQSPLSIPLAGVSEVLPGGGSRQGESIALEHTLLKKLKVTAGVRHAAANGVATQALAVGAVPGDYTSLRVRVDAPVPALPKATVFTQYEQALDDAALKDTTLGATYQVAPQTKFYATHQTSNSLSGDYALSPSQQNDTTVVGLDTEYMKDGKMFDEYRIGDGIDGREARAAIGLRNLWTLAPGLGLSTSIQQVHPISGVVTDRATALTTALQYTASPDWKGSARAEWSKSANAETWLTSTGVAVKISPDLTALARFVDNEQLSIGAGVGSNTLRQGQLGFALRPVGSDVWNALSWIEHKRTDNSTLGAGSNVDEAANIFSTHINVQPSADWIVTGRYGVKQALDFASGFGTSYVAQIVGTRSVWDVTEHWDVGLQYFVEFGGDGTATRQQAVGGEIGYLVMKNLWLSIGYNVIGFRDADLASEDYTQRSFYLRLRFKFDENLFKPSHNADALPANTAVMQ